MTKFDNVRENICLCILMYTFIYSKNILLFINYENLKFKRSSKPKFQRLYRDNPLYFYKYLTI